MVVPLNLLNTLQSPDFVSYMGVGRSDIRIDISRQGGVITYQYREIDEFLTNSSYITNHAVMVTAMYRVLNNDGIFENIRVGIGDFTAFPINYTRGRAPINPTEIALSHMNADEFGVNVGDTLILLVDGEQRNLTVSGIYNDITYGGRTAKGILPLSHDNLLWAVVNIEVTDGISISEIISELNRLFPNVSVTSIDAYISQTMGGLIEQLTLATMAGFGLGLVISGLITAMFFKMLIAKDTSQIAIMRSMGISYRDIRMQYVTRAGVVLIIGLVLGSITAVKLGQMLTGLLVPGISSMRFIINPIMSYGLSPLALGLVVVITVFVGCTSIRKIDVMKIMQ